MSDSLEDGFVHRVLIELYLEFKSVCEEHHLRYFAISGTTLGAVLWNGIIPWDDDMDIALPVEDYVKFVKLFKKGAFPKWIGFNEYLWFGGKIFDKKTTFTNVYYIDKPGRFSGISIDIVPLINVPDGEKDRLAFVRDLKQFHFSGVMFDRYNVLYGVKNKAELFCWRKKILEMYKFGETRYVMDFSDPRYVLKAEGFERPVVMNFDKTSIPVSSNYEDDLAIQYGKYKKYPSKEKRDSIHRKTSLIDLKRPCEFYEKALIDSSVSVKEIIKLKHLYEGFSTEQIKLRDDIIERLEEENFELRTDVLRLNEKLKSRRYKVADAVVRLVRGHVGVGR